MTNLGISRRNLVWSACLLPFTTQLELTAVAASSGRFEGRIATEWLEDGRNMRLLQPVEYISSSGRSWPVPAGVVVDGASIPPAFWSVIGGPFDGLYRGPSVVHDYYCETRTRRYEDVHEVFYDSMLSAGVPKRKAWLMYQAVATFGPSWPDPKTDPKCEAFDENFDLEKCARNSAKPAVVQKKLDESSLRDFMEAVRGQVDEADLDKIQLRAPS